MRRTVASRLATLTIAAAACVGCGGNTHASDGGNDVGSNADGAGDATTNRDAVPDTADVNVADAPTADVADATAGDASDASAPSLWSMGYWASWQASSYPTSAIEWSGLTHIAISFYEPASDGSLSLLGGNPSDAQAVVTAAHAHGVLAIASIGGSNSGSSFRTATASGTIDAFVTHLVDLAATVGYDGFDIDWEPLDPIDQPVAVDLANRLRAARPRILMTMPIGALNVNFPGDLSHFASIAAAYDQLNIMSYGVSGAWPGWKSWHSSPLYQTDSATPVSIDSSVSLYVAAGVPRAKLGIGIGFYGECYSPPVTGPDQVLNGSTVVANDGTMSYANILAHYFSASARQWDSAAHATYLTFASAHAPDGCTFISYDDDQSIGDKGAYIRAHGLGGVIEWEINEGYVPTAPAGMTNPLLISVHDHVLH